jgi:hypothetical protein
MTDAYIDARFDAIKAHASDVEARLDDSDLTPDRLKADNRAVIEGFRRTGEPVALIETDWQTAVETLLQTL